MFRHTLVQGTGKGEATVAISGDAVFTHAQEMQSALGEALEGCRHLTIDVGAIESHDGTFRVLLCSLHRRSELVNKRITMRGTLPGREGVQAGHAKENGCPFNRTNEGCPLWGSVL